jgi:hypothetical protein
MSRPITGRIYRVPGGVDGPSYGKVIEREGTKYLIMESGREILITPNFASSLTQVYGPKVEKLREESERRMVFFECYVQSQPKGTEVLDFQKARELQERATRTARYQKIAHLAGHLF